MVAIHNGIGEAVITADADNKVRLMNLAAEALTGLRKEEAIGLPLTSVCNVAGAGLRMVEDLTAKAASQSHAVELPAVA